MTHDAGAIVQESAFRLQQTCAASAARVLGLFFCPIAVWKDRVGTAKGRRRPSDGEIKAARRVVRIMGSKRVLLQTLMAA
jgi:hypothetical protein